MLPSPYLAPSMHQVLPLPIAARTRDKLAHMSQCRILIIGPTIVAMLAVWERPTPGYYCFSTLHWRLPQDAMFIDPEADLSAIDCSCMLEPPKCLVLRTTTAVT